MNVCYWKHTVFQKKNRVFFLSFFDIAGFVMELDSGGLTMLLDEIGQYWDTRAEGYSISTNNQLAGNAADRYRELLRQARPEGEKLNCLDIGCGPGFFSILLSQDGHCVTSLDYSSEMLIKAEANFAAFGVNPTVVQGDAQNLGFADSSFDMIVSRDLVWNLEQPVLAYSEWLRVLKPGGRIFVSDGNYYLYYYHPDYRRARELQSRGSHPCYGVDPTPINNIARDLPLSRQLRPDWDVRTLAELGLRNIQTRVGYREFTDPDTGETKKLSSHFVLWGEK